LASAQKIPPFAASPQRLTLYLVFYEVTDTEIIIHAVRHGARDPLGMTGSA
jgi:plasmid stabilization system protein ParE